MQTYRDYLRDGMKLLGEHPKTYLTGYNCTKQGGACGGIADLWPQDRCMELPLAEALMTGVAIGMSLEGWIPVLAFERSDFALLGLEQITNHLGQLGKLSAGQHRPAVIIRMVVGNNEGPLYTGPTHTRNIAGALKELVDFPVVELRWPASIISEYAKALQNAEERRQSTVLIDFRDEYHRTQYTP